MLKNIVLGAIFNLRATQRLQRGVVPHVGDEYLLHTARPALCSIFSIVTMLIEPIFGSCENWKTVMPNLPGFLFLKHILKFWRLCGCYV